MLRTVAAAVMLAICFSVSFAADTLLSTCCGKIGAQSALCFEAAENGDTQRAVDSAQRITEIRDVKENVFRSLTDDGFVQTLDAAISALEQAARTGDCTEISRAAAVCAKEAENTRKMLKINVKNIL